MLKRWMNPMGHRLLVAIVLLTAALGHQAYGVNIYLMHSGSSDSVIQDLTDLGHTVTTGVTPLTDYSSYDQVWDLRSLSIIRGADMIAMGDFLSDGGRMYITGEIVFARSRNSSIVDFVDFIEAGTISLHNIETSGQQIFTPEGAVVNTPNVLDTLTYSGATRASTTGGFLVTEYWNHWGYGSTIGWNYGDIATAPDSRMLISFDSQVLNPAYHGNANVWVENAVVYLTGHGTAEQVVAAPLFAIPEPATGHIGVDRAKRHGLHSPPSRRIN